MNLPMYESVAIAHMWSLREAHNIKKFILLGLATVLLFSGCIQTSAQKEYVCPDGSVVSDAHLCPKEEKTETKTEPKIQEKVVIYEESGEVQQAVTSAVLKEMTTPEGGTYSSNLYLGGEIEIIFSTSSTLNYVLMTGPECVTEGVGTTILKRGSIKDAQVTWKPSEEKVGELCIKLENPNFIDWNNIHPITYQITIKETQLRKE